MTEINLKFLEGDFEVLEKLGKGGMGQVFKARQKSLDRLVAIKILPLSLCKNTEFISRFKREARLAGKFYHPNAIQVFDIGENHGQYFYIMEYVEGGNLKEKLNKEGALNQAYVLDILKQVLLVLKEAENMKIIHRDIKPDNIMLTSDGVVKLADLGLAREINDDAGLTQQKIAIGTPHYMAPEQAQGKPVDMRADQYALGVTAFHLLTGQPPFSGKNNMEILVQHVKKPMPKPSSIVPEISPYMDKLILKMTEKEAKNRFQSIEDILKATEKVSEVISGTKEKNVKVTPKVKTERANILDRRREKNSSTGIFIFIALILSIALIYFFVDFGSSNPYQNIRENALYKVSLMQKENRYEDCIAELKEAIKKVPTIEQDDLVFKLNEIETILANAAIDKVMIVANDSAENCAKGVRELDGIIEKYGRNAAAAKPKKDKLLERIAQIKLEESKLLDAEKEKARDFKINKISTEANLLVNDKKFKSAIDILKTFKEKNADAGVKVNFLMDNILALEVEYVKEVLAKSDEYIRNHEYEKSTEYLKAVGGNLSQNEGVEKVDLQIKLNPTLKEEYEKEKVKLAKQAYAQTRESIFALLKIGEIKAAKIKLESYKNALSAESFDYLAKIVDSYSYIYNRIKDGLSNEYKEQLQINRLGNKNLDVLINSIAGGIIQYTFEKTKLELSQLNEDWGPTYSTIANKVTRIAKPERMIQLCLFAYVNGDLEGAYNFAKEAESLNADKTELVKYTKVAVDEYFLWLDIYFDKMIDKMTVLIKENNKVRAKQNIIDFVKRYGDTVIFKERKKEIDVLLEKLEGK